MTGINKIQRTAMECVEELLITDNNTLVNDEDLIKQSLLSNLAADFEEDKYPMFHGEN